MSVDPSELSEEELEERRQNLKNRVEEEQVNLEESEKHALEALKEGTDSDIGETHTVEVTGGVELEVIDELPGHLERKAASIREGDVTGGVDAACKVMAHLIQTDGFDSESVWKQYFEEYGSSNFFDCAMEVTEPYYNRISELENQRQFRGKR